MRCRCGRRARRGARPGPRQTARTGQRNGDRLARRTGRQSRLLLTAAAALTIALVVAGVRPVVRLDQAVAVRLHAVALQQPGLTDASRNGTDRVVDPWTMRLLLAAAVVWLWHRRQRLLAWWAACTSAVEWALRSVLRWAVGRNRPERDAPSTPPPCPRATP
ncbi:hypothetical protein [Streptomyces smyrnaeus]|uniref:hypothetical protein n=1 Tax=Streptomyces smyrnaeus TaxID=1387713 RepID=UPI0033ED50D4